MKNIYEDSTLKDMFIEMSTNRDLRNILKYYKEKGYDQNELISDFEDFMENITTEEIARRLEQDLYINFEGIQINNKYLDESLVGNLECKNVQLEIIAKRSDLSATAIQQMLDNEIAYPETIDIAIKNSTDDNIRNLTSERICLLNKESILKLVKCAEEDMAPLYLDSFLYLLSLKPSLTINEIDHILGLMKQADIKMDNLFADALLSQENLTKEQEKEIAFFEDVPSTVVFDICLNKDIYSAQDIEYFYERRKYDLEYINLILNYKDVPKSIISDIFINGNEDTKEILNRKTFFDIEFQNALEDLTRTDLTVVETKRLIDLIKEDARLIPYAVHSKNRNILKETLDTIEDFYKYCGIESIYKQRCELIRTLANNENIPNLVLFDITRYNSDVFSSDELDDINDKLMMKMSDEEIAIVDIQNTKAQEELDEYLLDMKIKGNRNYSGDYDYIDNEER